MAKNICSQQVSKKLGNTCRFVQICDQWLFSPITPTHVLQISLQQLALSQNFLEIISTYWLNCWSYCWAQRSHLIRRATCPNLRCCTLTQPIQIMSQMHLQRPIISHKVYQYKNHMGYKVAKLANCQTHSEISCFVLIDICGHTRQFIDITTSCEI